MRVAFFSCNLYQQKDLNAWSESTAHQFEFFTAKLEKATTLLAKGFESVCIFVNDEADREILQDLAKGGTRLLLLRSAGFDQVDLQAARELGIRVMRVPAYSPYAVAEHAVALIMTLNRKTHKAYNRVREQNFSLTGLMGFDLNGKTVGVVGTGKIGAVFAKIMNGFGCKLLGYDVYEDKELKEKYGLKYMSLEDVLAQSDIISLHLPLLPSTHHMINGDNIQKVKPGAMLINTSRGGIVDTKCLIKALKADQLGAAGLDVYEGEKGIFFTDLSTEVLADDTLSRLISMPNVLITGHQAFLTKEAQANIAETLMKNIEDYQSKRASSNDLTADQKKSK